MLRRFGTEVVLAGALTRVQVSVLIQSACRSSVTYWYPSVYKVNSTVVEGVLIWFRGAPFVFTTQTPKYLTDIVIQSMLSFIMLSDFYCKCYKRIIFIQWFASNRVQDTELNFLTDLPGGLDFNEWLASHSKYFLRSEKKIPFQFSP